VTLSGCTKSEYTIEFQYNQAFTGSRAIVISSGLSGIWNYLDLHSNGAHISLGSITHRRNFFYLYLADTTLMPLIFPITDCIVNFVSNRFGMLRFEASYNLKLEY